jgi:hypothetical protein
MSVLYRGCMAPERLMAETDISVQQIFAEVIKHYSKSAIIDKIIKWYNTVTLIWKASYNLGHEGVDRYSVCIFI